MQHRLCLTQLPSTVRLYGRKQHTHGVDIPLNKTMRIISGTLKSIPKGWLSVLTNIALTHHLRRTAAAHEQWLKINIYPLDTLTIQILLCSPSPTCLSSRKPIWFKACIQNNFNIVTKWNEIVTSSGIKNIKNIDKALTKVPGSNPTYTESAVASIGSGWDTTWVVNWLLAQLEVFCLLIGFVLAELIFEVGRTWLPMLYSFWGACVWWCRAGRSFYKV